MGNAPKQKPVNFLTLYKGFLKLFYLLAAGMAVFLIVRYAPLLKNVSVEDILSYTPSNFFLAGLVIWALYLIKSLTVFFPLMVLYVAVGTLFPPIWALGVNLIGLALCISLPYLIGRWMGQELVENLLSRYEKARRLSQFGTQNALVFSFVLRAINLLPGDLVSLLLGANEMHYLTYLAGSLLGLLPVMIPATLLGRSLADPLSSNFLIPCLLLSALLLAVVLLLAHRLKPKATKTATGKDSP